MYYKGWSGYSTIGGHSGSSISTMSHKSSIEPQASVDTCDSCPENLTSMDVNNKVSAMVSQAEIWQEDKKFTVISLYFINKFYLLYLWQIQNLISLCFQVYKVVIWSKNECWHIFRRYNEFNKLYEVLKKQVKFRF